MQHLGVRAARPRAVVAQVIGRLGRSKLCEPLGLVCCGGVACELLEESAPRHAEEVEPLGEESQGRPLARGQRRHARRGGRQSDASVGVDAERDEQRARLRGRLGSESGLGLGSGLESGLGLGCSATLSLIAAKTASSSASSVSC